MRLETWAVPLSFTCLVVVFAYLANEAARLVYASRDKRRALCRLATASMQLVHANGAVVSGGPLPEYAWPHSTLWDFSGAMPTANDAPEPAELSPISPVPEVAAVSHAESLPSRQEAGCPTHCSTSWAWGGSSDLAEPRKVTRRSSRGSANVAPAWIQQGSKALVDGWQRKAWTRSRSQNSRGQLPADQRQNALTNPDSPNQYRISSVDSGAPGFARSFARRSGRPMVHAHACHA
jgi:hypothetical protein